MLRIRLKQSARFMTPQFTAEEMRGIGEYVRDLNLARWDRAMNVQDQRAKGLQVSKPERIDKSGKIYFLAPRGYAIQKSRKGGRNIRDWKLTGAMRKALRVIDAAAGRVLVGWSDEPMFLRATYNQAIEPMFGISPNDKTALLARFAEVLSRKVKKAA